MYADDTQLYYSCNCNELEVTDTIKDINSDLSRISNFSKTNCLKLNAEKSKFIVIGSRHNLKKLKTIQLEPIKIEKDTIEREYEVKNLGIIFDEELTWTRHVNLSIAKAYGKLRHANRFKNFLDEETKWKLTETYVLSQFNYGDIILQNLSDQLQKKIQKLQNGCVRFAFGLRKYDHISEFVKNKKILNMNNRRLLHSLTLMFRIKNYKAPNYLCNRISDHTEIHNHFTRNRLNINPPFARTKLRSMSYFVFISNKFNDLSKKIEVNGISVGIFKKKCREHLLKSQ